jgi:hypothetical protein
MSYSVGHSDVEKCRDNEVSGSCLISNGNDVGGDGAKAAVTESGPVLQTECALQLTSFQETTFMVFITLTQLVQMVPLGAAINSGLAIGEALGASHIQSVWIVASYPLTQGAFVLVGTCSRVVPGRTDVFTY